MAGDVANVTRAPRESRSRTALAYAGFRIEPFAGDGKLLFEDRADARQFVRGIGGHMHKRTSRLLWMPPSRLTGLDMVRALCTVDLDYSMGLNWT